MADRPLGVLVTRQAEAATETASRVAALGFQPVAAPLFRVEPRAADLPPPDTVQAVLVTSANAPPALGRVWHSTRLFAVGDATASVATSSGFAHVESAGLDAVALARMAADRLDPSAGPLLLASGQGQGEALEADLAARGFIVLRREVYATLPLDAFPPEAAAALAAGRIGSALFFSPATARLFRALYARTCPEKMLMGVEALVISQATAEACAPLPWARIRVAHRPNQDELLALLT